jgi:hypothetical protein
MAPSGTTNSHADLERRARRLRHAGIAVLVIDGLVALPLVVAGWWEAPGGPMMVATVVWALGVGAAIGSGRHLVLAGRELGAAAAPRGRDVRVRVFWAVVLQLVAAGTFFAAFVVAIVLSFASINMC